MTTEQATQPATETMADALESAFDEAGIRAEVEATDVGHIARTDDERTLSLRDYFAAKAMQAMFQGFGPGEHTAPDVYRVCAREAYAVTTARAIRSGLSRATRSFRRESWTRTSARLLA